MIFLKVLEIVFPVFFLSSLGYFWVRLGFEYPMKFVMRLSMMIAVPCLVFVSLTKTTIDSENLILLTIAAFSTYFLLIIFLIFFIKLTGIDFQTYLAPLTFGNTGNIGLPLAYFAFGEVGLGYAVIIFSVTAILSFSIGIWFVSGGAISFQALKKEPLIIATILGAIFLFTDASTPLFLTSTLELIGQIAIPLMLITLGVAMADLKINDLKSAVAFSVLKLFLCLSAGIFVGYFFSLNEISFSVLLMQISTPVAVTSYLLARKYKADSLKVASLVVVSTCLSLIYLPTILFFQLHSL